MASQVLLLLLLLISNIHAEVIQRAGTSHHFSLDSSADYCSVSRWTSEGEELLWNAPGSYFWLSPLDVSHSGQYQEQCWSRGWVTHQRNSTLIVCGDRKMRVESLYPDVGQTVELTCDSVGPNPSVQWAYERESLSDELVLIDNKTSSTLQLVKNKPSLLLTVGKRSFDTSYYCLEKQQHRCDLHSRFSVDAAPESVLRSVGESLELNCSGGSGDERPRWRLDNSLSTHTWVQNSSLMFPSLTLDHTGQYICELFVSGREYYDLYVCPESEPPAVVHFTGGEKLSLHCGDWNQSDEVHWFMRSNRTDGRVSRLHKHRRPDNMYPSDMSLVMTDVSPQDSGQFWCVVKKDYRCVFRSETLVMFREPEVDHHLARSVPLSAVTVMMLCVVVVVGVMVRRKREQLPAPVEELEMSQLPPESDAQEETPL